MLSTIPASPPSLGRALNFAAGAGSSVANTLLAPHGLSLAQWAVLMCLWRNSPLTGKQLSDLTGNAPPATSRIVDRMVKTGLLERAPDPQDRRAVFVTLTDSAEALRPLEMIYKEVNAILTADLSDGEVTQLFDLLARTEAAGRAWLVNAIDTTGE